MPELSCGEADTLFGKAVEYHVKGSLEPALSLYEAVIRLNPNIAAAHCNRALVLQALSRFHDALNDYNRAVTIEPNYPDAFFNRGILLRQLDRLDEAVESYDQAIRHQPDHFEAYNNRGNALRDLKRLEEALESFERAIALRPDYADAHFNRGSVLKDLARADEALQSYHRAIKLRPGFAEAYNNMGVALQALKHSEEALAAYDAAIALKPDFAMAYNNRGQVLRDLARLEEALQSFDRAIEIEPHSAEAHLTNRGNVLTDLRRFDAALRSFDEAIALRSDYANAYWCKSLCALLMGNFDAGWPLYEWRKKLPEPMGLRSYPQPCWSGRENVEGKTLYIYAEQGYGDTFQFCRYALLARHLGARVVLGVQDAVVRLLRSLCRDIMVEGLSQPPAEFDYHIALLSMPLAFQTSMGTCPAKVPYLRAEPERVAQWKSKIGSEGFRIGICWQGSRAGNVDVGRSFPLRLFEGLARISNVRLISLQKDDGVEQLLDLPTGMTVETLGEEFDAGSDAFLDTAAVMESLDLVISSDTAIAHLAGALGRPVWVALKHVPDWRWLLDRADSPWYPTMRLFRQPTAGDWAAVFAAIQSELAQRVQDGSDGARDNPHMTAKKRL